MGINEYHDDTQWPGVFEDSAVERVALPSTLKKIEYSAFSGCRNLRDVLLPEGFETIGR